MPLPLFRLLRVSVRALLVGALVPALLGASVARAQNGRPLTPRTADATRAALTHLLDSLQQADAAGGGSKKEKKHRADEIATTRTRLANGDFHVGDRFLLTIIVLGAATPAAQGLDSVIVRDSLMVTVGSWPSVSLQGVLRSELQAFMQRYASAYIREPSVKVFPLTRLSFTGGVGRPGFYSVDPSRPLSDAVTAAGLGAQSQSDKITVFRGKEELYDKKETAEVLQQGRTIDELGLISGDEVHVGLVKQTRGIPTYQIALIGFSIFSAVLALIRASYVD